MRQIIFDFGRLHLLDWQFMLRVYGYGLMLVLGFVFAMALAKWRARRMGEDSDAITYVCLLSLVSGVVGARVAYIIQKWNEFSAAPNPLLSMLDITSGGLIYYGGLVLGIASVLIYLRVKHLPMRRYLDILAPSIMLGLAFGRMGCLLNGCCYGGLCSESSPIAMHFPMYSKPLVKLDGNKNPFSQGTDGPSPAYEFQLRQKLISPPKALLIQIGPDIGQLHAPRYLHGALGGDQLAVVMGDEDQAHKLFLQAAPLGLLDEARWQKLVQAPSPDGLLRGSEFWDEAASFATPHNPAGERAMDFEGFWQYCQARRAWLLEQFDADHDGKLAPGEAQAANRCLQADLLALASEQHALALRPAQALGAIGAALLALLLTLYSRLRKREGQVFAMMMVTYPVFRFFEELIRADNPHDLSRLVLTHNQYTSIAMFALGIVMFLLLRRMSPSCGPTWAQRQAAQSAGAGKENTRRS